VDRIIEMAASKLITTKNTQLNESVDGSRGAIAEEVATRVSEHNSGVLEQQRGKIVETITTIGREISATREERTALLEDCAAAQEALDYAPEDERATREAALKKINDDIARNIKQEHDEEWKRDQAEMEHDAVDDRKEREDAAKAEARRKAEEAKQRFRELSQ